LAFDAAFLAKVLAFLAEAVAALAAATDFLAADLAREALFVAALAGYFLSGTVEDFLEPFFDEPDDLDFFEDFFEDFLDETDEAVLYNSTN
jgi:hypothetical protein